MEEDEISESLDKEEFDRIFFREVQYPSRVSMWFLLATVVVVVVVSVVLRGFAVEAGILITLLLVVGGVLYSMRLTTEVGDNGVYLRLFPLHLSNRKIPFDEIESIEKVEYSPLEYWGWGLKLSVKGNVKAYTIKGREGVRIERSDSTSFIIGSQKPEQLVESMEEASSDT